MITGDGEMASSSSSTAGQATESSIEISRLGGIEALRLKMGPVRRNLFGPVDHQQLQEDFQRLLCINLEAANKRWNFDFQSEMPEKGSSMEWEELRCQDVPAFYRSCMVKPASHSLRKRRMSTSSRECSSGSNSSSGSGDEFLEVTTRGYYRIKLQRKRRQSSITDFFKVKKSRLLHHKAPSRH
ncbi:cyclin-dependent kinase inhibitor 1D isoform X2 [Notolabrus celidotus]|uniref:cyclin-dependent kinase inhibitor 1D isoform X2 n=1 Tax=Notolabrus celidotus TaxID=1203425 RepID=UPI00148F8913|nr:cyclin-dependent kinase inhibitor 1D isoform X2 [Notolabrus celidotus]